MSDDEKPKAEDTDKASQTDVSPQVQTISLDRIVKNPESQGITINFYPSNCSHRSDKPVQTDPSQSQLFSDSSKNKNRGSLTSESRELRSFEYSPPTFKNAATFTSHEPKPTKLMSSRRFPDKSTGRTSIDLERKKLEAELKATEEIVKLQQTVIEKRLALELASLQDGSDYPHKVLSPQQSIPHADLQAIDEVAMKRQSMMEHNLSQDFGSVTRVPPPRPPPPSRMTEGGKFGNVKTDSGFMTQTPSDLNPIRNLLEKKMHLDRRSSRTESKHSATPTNSNYQDRKHYQDSRHSKGSKNFSGPPPSQPGCSPRGESSYKARTMWRSAMRKIKKKLKPTPKPLEPWR